jgi:gluconolactonase
VIYARGLAAPETPVFKPDGSLLVVETALSQGTVTLISVDGQVNTRIAHTGRPNGLALGADGSIWVAESLRPSLVHVAPDHAVTVAITHSPLGEFLFPNDLCFGVDGLLYMTDSGFLFDDLVQDGKVREDFATMPYDGKVYRIDPQSLECRVIERGLQFTNGVVAGLQGALYINETISGAVSRYWPAADGQYSIREPFGNVLDGTVEPRLRGPDGMALGNDGSVYVAVWGEGEVIVLDPNGKVSERIKTEGQLPSNLAFGINGEHAIYVTEQERGTVERFAVPTSGAPVHHGWRAGER